MNIRKVSALSLLIATIFLGGCSQKDVEIDVASNDNATKQQVAQDEKTSESTLDVIEEVKIEEDSKVNESTASVADEKNNGSYFEVAGQKVFLENVYFAFDKFNLSEDMREVSKQNALKLTNLEDGKKIKLEGNCDEWGSDEYNYALGLKRAKVAKDALIADGIASDNITMISYGESNPTCNEHNIDCWKQNRRVEFKILP